MPRLLEARWVRDFVLWLRFGDGSEGEVKAFPNLEAEIDKICDHAHLRATARNSFHS